LLRSDWSRTTETVYTIFDAESGNAVVTARSELEALAFIAGQAVLYGDGVADQWLLIERTTAGERREVGSGARLLSRARAAMVSAIDTLTRSAEALPSSP